MNYKKYLQLPTTGTESWGWLKKYILGWFVPYASSGLALGSMAYLFMNAILNSGITDYAGLPAALMNVVDHYGKKVSSPWGVRCAWIFLGVTLVIYLGQYFVKNGAGFRRRQKKINSPLAFWSLFGATKVLGLVVAPLSIAVGIGYVFQMAAIWCSAVILLSAASLIAAALFFMMYEESTPQKIMCIHVRKANQGAWSAINVHAELELTWEILSGIAGSTASMHIACDRSNHNGILVLGYQQPDAAFQGAVATNLANTLHSMAQRWSSLGFDFSLCDCTSSVAEQPSQYLPLAKASVENTGRPSEPEPT